MLKIIQNKLMHIKQKFFSNIFDVTLAGGALLALSPLLIGVAIAIRLESKGKVYYISKRVGANFKIFDFYKLRSMYPDADKRLRKLEHLNAYAQNDEVKTHVRAVQSWKMVKNVSPTVYFDGDEICEYLHIKKCRRKTFLKIVDDPRITKVERIYQKYKY